MQFRILGAVTATHDGKELPLGGPKQRLVLALLLSSPGDLVTTDRLIESVWRGEPPANPRGSLHVYLSNLRRALVDVELEHRDEGYVLHVDDSQIDADRFAQLVDKGTSLLTSEPGRAGAALRDALALWRGRPFGGLADEPALAVEVARLEELRLRALEARIEADLAQGLHGELVGELRELTDQHPLRERFWGQLVLALYRSGRQAEALRAYESARGTLADQLGIDPAPFLQELHTQMLRQDPAIGTPSGSASTDLPAASTESRVETVAIGSVRGYELLEKLGAGSLGVVYRGYQPSVVREVAIKVVRPELANDPEFVRRFEVEAQRVARLEHPHIVPLYDYWREPDAAYLVMRLLRGGSLAQVLPHGGWSLPAAAAVIDQVAAALDYVHRQGVAHLDVKPANILLDTDGNAYLSDFGIARHAATTTDRTLPYLSPEHLSEEALSAATDVFGLGLVAFQVLTGHHPYEGASPDTLPERVRQRPLPALGEFRPELSDTVEEVLRRATASDPHARFATAGELAAALRSCTGGPIATVPEGPVRNPYKGLRAFEESDAGDFFGRERLVEQLLDRLAGTGRRSRLITVVGPSGSGKSSLARAGLIPALRAGRTRGSERWFTATMRPGARPMAELHRAIVEVAACDPDAIDQALDAGEDGLLEAVELALPDSSSELLLLVDQFEELFSLADEGQRRRFADRLRHAAARADGRVRVVLTVRADFYDHMLLDPALGEVVAATTLAVPALTTEELERAVAEPAQAVGVRLDRDLLAQIVNDVATAPGALPLLQYALTELFSRRSDEALTLESYRAIGGAQGALAGRAEQLYASLDPLGQEACRQLLLRLVTVDEVRADVRRRVLRHELAHLTSDDTIDEVLETFGRHRLLTFDRDPTTREPTVEVTHEALLDAWDRLRGWIEQARTDLLMHQRLLTAAEEWVAAGRDDAYLLHGTRLAEFDRWAPHSEVVLTDAEQELLDASRAAERDRERAEQARRQHEEAIERRSANRLRAVAVVSVIAALAAASLSLLAIDQRDQAHGQERVATARGLANASAAELSDDPELSILLATEAVRTTWEADGSVVPEAETALREALRQSHVVERIPTGSAISVAPDGRIATLGTGGDVRLWEPDGTELRQLRARSSASQSGSFLGPGDDIDFRPTDGSALVVGHADYGAIHDAATGEELTRFTEFGEDGTRVEMEIARPRYSPDGERVAAVALEQDHRFTDVPDPVGVWDADTGDRVALLGGHTHEVADYAFSPDGARLVTTAPDGVRMWDVDEEETDWFVAAGEGDLAASAVAFDPDGDRVALGSQEGPVLLRDADDGDRIATLPGHASRVRSVAFAPDGDRLVTTSGNAAIVWELGTGEQLFALRGHRGAVTDVAFAPDGDRVITTSTDGTTRIWNVSVEGGFEYAALPTWGGAPTGTPIPAFRRDGPELAVSGTDGDASVWNVETLEQSDPFAGPEVHTIAYSGDGQTLATASGDRPSLHRIDVWGATTGELRRTWSQHQALQPGLALNDDGSVMAVSSALRRLHLFDVATGEVADPEVTHSPLHSVAYTPDDEWLVVGARDDVHVFDVDTGEDHMLDGLDGAITDVAVLEDDEVLVAEGDGTLSVFDVESGEKIRTFARESGANDLNLQLAAGEEAEAVAVAGGPTVRVRDLETGARRFDLDFEDRVGHVDLSPDGRYLVAVVPPWVHLHVVGVDDLLDLAETRVTRSLTDAECDEFFLDDSCPDRD